MRDARKVLRKLDYNMHRRERDFRPELDEQDIPLTHFQGMCAYRRRSINRLKMISFALFSTRRQEEITRRVCRCKRARNKVLNLHCRPSSYQFSCRSVRGGRIRSTCTSPCISLYGAIKGNLPRISSRTSGVCDGRPRPVKVSNCSSASMIWNSTTSAATEPKRDS